MMAKPYSMEDSKRHLLQWRESSPRQSNRALGDWMAKTEYDDLLTAVFGASPFLSKLLLTHPDILWQCCTQGADTAHARLLGQLSLDAASLSHAELMKCLRIAKGRLSLLVGLADMVGWWDLEKVTGALSGFAELCLNLSLHSLLTQADSRKEITLPNPQNPQSGSGIVVLGMGKLGGRELNYSSDIDLIVLFEKGRLNYQGRHNEQQFMNKLAHDLVHVMQERTADGYVFRTDLRLRPDPASTPPAINIDAAYNYYESVGQNWERAAMIKARPVAGDIEAGLQYLKNIAPFMWRRSLDFASIQDIHSIKRQMDTHHSKKILLKGHNIKLGMGGIREIEFYAQIHQLIWGGRMPVLRLRGTCETLSKLAELGLIEQHTKTTLVKAYEYHRKLEHRLQMVADEQTHSLPDDDAELLRIARFMGYEDTSSFMRDTQSHLEAVHDIFAGSFKSSEKLGDEGNLVFTGVTHDPDTLETLRGLGYAQPETVSEIVMGWHHGSKRATRTKRARELLTELMPTLLKRLAETANPDAAFLKFNDFLTNLPAGVQLFSLFNINPELLGLMADIMGSAPTLAENLSKSPALLDAVLQRDFYEALPTEAQLSAQLAEIMPVHHDFESRIEALTRFRNEKQFQAGVQLLKHMISAEQSGHFLSTLAELLLKQTLTLVHEEFARSHGHIQGGQFAIIGMGKLGSCELTFGSDIDLIFVYDAPDEALSDGEKQFNASVYYNRLAQRLLNALTAMGREGRLYEVDTRLRPSGGKGVLASSLAGLHKYFEESAWTFEYMAFTKARAVAGDEALMQALARFADGILSKPKDAAKLKQDVKDMRERIEKEFPASSLWDIKYARGGLIDVDFLAQYLLLLHAPTHGRPPVASTRNIMEHLAERNAISPELAEALKTASISLNQLFHMLRLCNNGGLDEDTALPGLKRLLATATDSPSFDTLKAKLIEIEEAVMEHYSALLH